MICTNSTLCATAAFIAMSGLTAPALAQGEPSPAESEATESRPVSASEPANNGDDWGTLLEPEPAERPAGGSDETAATGSASETPSQSAAEPGDATTATTEEADAGALDTIPVQVADESPVPMAAEPASARGIEEIVVTARRTEENLQDVPVAIAVITADDLRREAIDDAQDLQGRVPSLVIGPAGQQRNTETPTIRGQGATYGASPGVVIYFAEVPLPLDSVSNNQGGPGKFFDLSNLQVLKGAQGTLFGRNTTGGALLLTPARPTEEFEGYLQAEATSLSGRGYEGVINVPVSENVLVRAGAKQFSRDGFTHDVVTGKDYDSKDYWTGRLGVTWRLTDNVENYALAYYAQNDDNGTGNVVEAINSEGFNAAIMGIFGLPVAPGVPPQQQPGCLYFNVNSGSRDCGQDIAAAQRERGNRHVHLGADPNDVLKTGGFIDVFSWQLSDTLTLRNIASYSFFEHQFRWDLDGSSAGLDDIVNANGQNQSDTKTYTEELQLQGSALEGRLVYVVGGFYERTLPRGPQSQVAVNLFSPAESIYETSRYSYAPYAQGTYDFGGIVESLDGLKITAGLRYTYDFSRSYSSYNNVRAEVDGSAPTYTVGLDYQFGEANLVYGKLSRGYKTGGFSMLAVNPNNYYFDPEYVTNYELGLKSDTQVGETPVRINLALYHTDYEDLQRTAGDSYVAPDAVPGTPPSFGGATYNVGAARIAGAELDATLQPTDNLQLTASYAYTKAEYEEFSLVIGTVTAQRDCSGREIARGDSADFSCIPYQFAPEHQYSLTARYSLPIDERFGTTAVSGTYSWIGKQYTAPASVPEAEPGAWLESVGLLNLSAEWEQILGSSFDVQAYVTNALDKEYRIGNSNVYNVLFAQASMYGEPRVIGVHLRYRWGAE